MSNPQQNQDVAPAVATKGKKKVKLCGCGCKGQVTRNFLPGHDAKLKSAMQRAHRAGAKKVDGTTLSPAQVADEYGWQHFLTDKAKPAKKAAKAKVETTKKTVKTKGKSAPRKSPKDKASEAQEQVENQLIERAEREHPLAVAV